MRERIVFKDNPKSYLAAALLGIAAGLLVAFFARLSGDDLWGLSLFSSRTIGFWLFTCSLIAMFSSKHYAAGINVFLYVYLMFYITGIFKRLAVVAKVQNTMSYFYAGLYQELRYGLIRAPYALRSPLFFGSGERISRSSLLFGLRRLSLSLLRRFGCGKWIPYARRRIL